MLSMFAIKVCVQSNNNINFKFILRMDNALNVMHHIAIKVCGQRFKIY